MRKIRVYAPAKLNLYLGVLDKRSDGYHNIETVFEKIDLKDELIIKEKGKGIKVKAGQAFCSQGKENIAYKAAMAICKEARVRLNLEIEIKKRIPVAAGLGGGSSDAASTLRAINEIFEFGIQEEKLFSIACNIGKDVPFFMLDKPFATGQGMGELLEPLDIKHVLFHIVIKPDISLSTTVMYRRIDRNNCLTRPHSLKDTVDALKKGDITLLEKNYCNAFENALAKDSVYINRVKALLSNAGAQHSLLSGSGPSVFCTFKNKKEAKEVFKKIQKGRFDIFLVKTYKGGIYGDNRG